MKQTEWDGSERRSGDDRRKVTPPVTPFQEYPKMVHGQVVQNAEHEAAILANVDEPLDGSAATAPPRKAGKKK